MIRCREQFHNLSLHEESVDLHPTELLSIVRDNCLWEPETTYDVLLDESDDLFLDDLSQRFAFYLLGEIIDDNYDKFCTARGRWQRSEVDPPTLRMSMGSRWKLAP